MRVRSTRTTTHTRHCAMSEGAGAEATSLQTSSSGAAASAATAAPSADPLATGEAVDELMAANEDHQHLQKRKYPEPGFALQRSGPAGGRGSYSIGDKVKAAGFTRVLCEDGKPVGNHGAAKVLGVNKRRIIEWVQEEEKLKGKMKANPKVSNAKTLHAGGVASTVDVGQDLEDYINEQRKQHLGCGT